MMAHCTLLVVASRIASHGPGAARLHAAGAARLPGPDFDQSGMTLETRKLTEHPRESTSAGRAAHAVLPEAHHVRYTVNGSAFKDRNKLLVGTVMLVLCMLTVCITCIA